MTDDYETKTRRELLHKIDPDLTDMQENSAVFKMALVRTERLERRIERAEADRCRLEDELSDALADPRRFNEIIEKLPSKVFKFRITPSAYGTVYTETRHD